MEAQAAGLRIVTSRLAALPETVGDCGWLVEGDWLSPAYQHEFADAVVKAMTVTDEELDDYDDDPLWPTRAQTQESARLRFSWDGVVEQWEELFEEVLAEEAKPVLPEPEESGVRPTLRSTGKISVDFVLTPTVVPEKVDPAAPLARWTGGGSVVGGIGLARALAARGDFDVRLHSNFTRSATVEGVLCLPLEQQWEERDVVVAYYDTRPLAGVDPRALRVASHHSYIPPSLWSSGMGFDFADVNTAPSAHAAATMKGLFAGHGRWEILPNALADEGVYGRRRPVAGQVLYHTAPDRGLVRLLEAWPEILRHVPEARLRVVGRVREHIRDGLAIPHRGSVRQARFRRFERVLAEAEAAGGVVLLGGLSRPEVLRELETAACFAFPADVATACETFSISTMECLLGGVPVVLSPVDALSEVYVGRGPVIAGRADDGGPDMDHFVSRLVEVLRAPEDSVRVILGRRYAETFTYEAAASAFAEIVRSA
jgi:glycosyltransferase involved in cell wall biosynthesis